MTAFDAAERAEIARSALKRTIVGFSYDTGYDYFTIDLDDGKSFSFRFMSDIGDWLTRGSPNGPVETYAVDQPGLSPELQKVFDEEFEAGREALEYLQDR